MNHLPYPLDHHSSSLYPGTSGSFEDITGTSQFPPSPASSTYESTFDDSSYAEPSPPSGNQISNEGPSASSALSAPSSPPPEDIYKGLTLADLVDSDPGRAPDYPMHILMQVAIQGSTYQRLRQSEIRDALIKRFPYFETAGKTWQNTLRHALTNKKCFYKVPKPARIPGRGFYWAYKPVREVKKSRTSQPNPARRIRVGPVDRGSSRTQEGSSSQIAHHHARPSAPSFATSSQQPGFPSNPNSPGRPYTSSSGPSSHPTAHHIQSDFPSSSLFATSDPSSSYTYTSYAPTLPAYPSIPRTHGSFPWTLPMQQAQPYPNNYLLDPTAQQPATSSHHPVTYNGLHQIPVNHPPHSSELWDANSFDDVASYQHPQPQFRITPPAPISSAFATTDAGQASTWLTPGHSTAVHLSHTPLFDTTIDAGLRDALSVRAALPVAQVNQGHSTTPNIPFDRHVGYTQRSNGTYSGVPFDPFESLWSNGTSPHGEQ